MKEDEHGLKKHKTVTGKKKKIIVTKKEAQESNGQKEINNS